MFYKSRDLENSRKNSLKLMLGFRKHRLGYCTRSTTYLRLLKTHRWYERIIPSSVLECTATIIRPRCGFRSGADGALVSSHLSKPSTVQSLPGELWRCIWPLLLLWPSATHKPRYANNDDYVSVVSCVSLVWSPDNVHVCFVAITPTFLPNRYNVSLREAPDIYIALDCCKTFTSSS